MYVSFSKLYLRFPTLYFNNEQPAWFFWLQLSTSVSLYQPLIWTKVLIWQQDLCFLQLPLQTWSLCVSGSDARWCAAIYASVHSYCLASAFFTVVPRIRRPRRFCFDSITRSAYSWEKESARERERKREREKESERERNEERGVCKEINEDLLYKRLRRRLLPASN